MELLLALLQAPALTPIANTIQIVVLAYMLRVLMKVSSKTNDLHRWHDVSDPANPGRKLWWENPAIAKSLDVIASTGEKQTDLLRKIHDEEVRQSERLDRMKG